ncbi:glycosyltransferase [uncultured Cellulomonas sp.]|uniref:glycosyltransferase n=1 Tax=uncultured Cellulomonas sp. TaxID=189682 RepID=UPI0028E9F3F5|nr:glycosyltransferase [uncultured Cellulomonas sp.]
MRAPVEHAVVVVPARDEEQLVGRCLAALQAARQAARAVRPGLTVDLVLVLDRCTDGTRSVALGHLDVRLVDVDHGRAGAARAAGVRDALARTVTDPGRTWVASTDADSAVPEGWILEQLRLADAGADVVVGTVRPDPADLSPDQLAAWRTTRIPGRPNGHVHGANLGVRADAYLQVGGFRDAPEHEDVDLVGALVAAGARVVATDAGDVLTSGRLVGRTPGGYAGYLRSRFGTDDVGTEAASA